jgi:hypothetical protein
MDATQAFRATAGNGSAQAKKAFEKMSTASAEATDLIKNSYSTAVKGAQDLTNPLIFRWSHKRQRTRGFRAA